MTHVVSEKLGSYTHTHTRIIQVFCAGFIPWAVA